MYKNHLAKNIPVDMEYRYPGAPPSFGEPPVEKRDIGVRTVGDRVDDESDDGDGCTF